MCEISNIGARLKEERKRLGYTQAEFAAVAGIGRTTQITYERGVRFPGAKCLLAIASTGADVQYILTGVITGATLPAVFLRRFSRLTQEFIHNYEALDEDDKRTLELMVSIAHRKQMKRSRKSGA